MTRGPSPNSFRRARKRVASVSAMRIPPRSHIRGLHEKICKAFAPSPCAISSDPEMSPAMLVWIPMRMLPSFQAGISGGGGASGRYSSAASNVKAIRSICSAIPSKVPEPTLLHRRAAHAVRARYLNPQLYRHAHTAAKYLSHPRCRIFHESDAQIALRLGTAS